MEKINYKNQGSRVKGGKLSSYSGSPPILGGNEGVVIRRSNHPHPSSTSTPPSPLFSKEGVPKAGAFDKEGKPQGREVKKLLLFLFTVLSLAAPAHALDISDYTAYPPFLPRVTSPNILFLLDYSKSMVRPAYGNCKSVSDYSDAGGRDADVDDDGSATGEPTSDVAAQNISDCRTTFNQIGVGEITLTGTVSVTNGSATVTGTGTQFSTALSAGNRIRIKNVDYTVKSIESNTSLTLIGIPDGATFNYRGTTESGLTAYKVGTLIGTVSVTINSATVTGTGTSFSTELAVGGTIILKDVPYTISSIASDTSLTLASSYTGTTASGFSARKGDAYSKVTPYSGYFDNGYSGSGSYSDSSAYKYTCNDASNGTCEKSSSGAWNGNWLNWLTATQFDILKKVAIGGDVSPAPEQSAPGTVRSILTDGYSFRKTMALKDGDTNSNTILDYCEGKIPDALCKMWPDMAGKYSWMSTPASAYYVFGPNENVNGSVEEASLPFPFTFYGNTYTRIYVNDNGWFSFTSGYSSASSNADMPSSGAPNNIIAPFWDRLLVNGDPAGTTNDSTVSTFTEGSAPNRIFHVRFEKMYHNEDTGKADPLTFEALLYEGSNHIVFQYNKVTKTSSTEPFFARGRSATVGVENSDGTRAKKYLSCDASSSDTDGSSNNCGSSASGLLSDGQAIFATPHLSFTVTPRSGATDFQPAAPFDFAPSGSNPAGYKVEINVSENTSCTAEGVGCFYNKDRNKYYDHQTIGLLQDFRDGELGGTLGFRLGIMQLNATDGGSVVKHFNAKDTTGWSSLMNATRSQTPLTNTPLAEALYEATGYFSETESWDYGSDWTYHSTGSTCASTGTNYDPYCSQSAAQRVPCCKSFVLLVSSGNYSNDNRTNIYGDADDANGTINAGALKAIDGGSLTSGTTGEGTKLNGGYLDNVAYKAHTGDWRSDLEGTQNLSLYVVNTFGEGSGDGTNILKKAAKYGGFEDKDDDSAYDADKYNLVSGTCTSVDSGGTYGEDDKDCDGDPDTYFEASGGSDLKNTIIDAVTEIMKSSASGTSVSVLSTSAGGEGAIYQAYFYPAKVEGTTDERAWPGFIKSFFLDKKQNLRDDSSGGTYTCSGDSCTNNASPDAALVATEDKIAQMCLNTTTNEVKVKLYADSNGDYATDTTNDGSCPGVGVAADSSIVVGMDDVVSIWEAGKKLALRDKSTRNIYTWVPTSVSATNSEGFSSLSGTPMDFTDANKTLLSPYLRASDPDGANPRTAEGEAQNIINFIRGNHIDSLAGTVSGVDYRYTYRNRCVSVGGTGDNCSTGRSWALGDIINSTPTLVSGPGEQYDLLYKDSDYLKFRSKYQNRRRMVYVGANDGMLHAFNAGLFNESTTSFSDNPSVNGWTDPTPVLGDELWAFVPYDNLPHLQWLACNGTESDPSQCGSSEYTHVYYVDARPKVTDVRIFSNTDSESCSGNGPAGGISGQTDACHPGGWGTIMIMSMRLGGGAIDVTIGGTNREFRSAYYAFDVTDPEKPPKLLWRFYDSTLGFTTSYPAIVRICSAGDNPCTGTIKWYMVVGSGPNNKIGTQASGIRDYGGNSTDMAGKVFVIDLEDGSPDKTFTLESSNAYMGDPLVVDKDFDFTSDVIYIGSSINTGSTPVAGKVYRINTNGTFPSTTGTNWTSSTLFNATKPVLTAPSVAMDNESKLWVFFGTGRLRNSGDPSDLTNSEQQAFYGIKDACWENTLAPTATPTPGKCDTTDSTNYAYVTNDLLETSGIKITVATGGTQVEEGTIAALCAVGSSCNYSELVNYVKSKKGWFVNLNDPATASERVLSRAAVLGGVVLFTTYTPAASICSIFGDSRLYALNFQTGTAYNKAIVGSSSTGVGASASTTGTYVSKAIELGKGMPTAVGIAVGEKVTGFVQKSTGEIIRIEAEPGTSVKSGAASWREKTGGGGTSEIETIYKHIVK